MHLTLHMTNACNLNCEYCYEEHHAEYMTRETAEKAVELAVSSGEKSCGIIFFGGEPLLCKDLIYDIVELCRKTEKISGTRFYFKMTTNGILLDSEFLKFSKKEGIFIALSHDGSRESHDRFRKDRAGTGTYDRLELVIAELLQTHPYAPVMMTVCPETVGGYADGVMELWAKGFRYFICSLNYAGDWKAAQVRELKRQYGKLADLYYEMTKREEKFYFSPFEVKIASHIKGKAYCHERCELGRKQISVAPDGSLYPCTQFVGDREYQIGHVERGLDEAARYRLYLESEADKAECGGCVVQSRCNCRCGCLNYQVTGSINHVAPMLCRHEQVVIPIVDRLAKRLYREKCGMFIQKHYNDMYPLISLIEDTAR